MNMKTNSTENEQCNCSKIPAIYHELSQSLLVIYAYVSGCRERLKIDTIDKQQLSEVLQKINIHTDIIAQNLQYLI